MLHETIWASVPEGWFSCTVRPRFSVFRSLVSPYKDVLETKAALAQPPLEHDPPRQFQAPRPSPLRRL